jgi:acyl carrier protein
MADRDSIRKLLVEILESDTGNSYSELSETDNLREGLGLDSVDVVSVVSQIERRFKIRMTHEELEKLVTVSDVLDLLCGKLANLPQAA